MENISIIILVLSCVWFCHCEVMRDPHDMFEIFKDKPSEVHSEEVAQQIDNKSDCRQIPRSKSCTDFLDTLLQSLDQLFPIEEDNRDHDFSLRLSLTLSEIHMLKQRSLHSLSEDKLCSTLQLSIKREPLRTLFLNFFYDFKDILNWTLEMINELRYQIKFNFQINLKDYVVYLWIMTFISCLFIMMKFRSMVLTLGWILLCVIFISTYTTYQYKYQAAVAEKEALLMPYKNMDMPKECSNPKKSRFTELWESFFGAGPVEMSHACKQFYKKINISPDVEVKMSDALGETIFGFFSKILHAVFVTADNVADLISEKQSFFSRTIVYWLIHGMVLLFALSILLFYAGGEISFYGFRINQSHTHTPLQMHRQCVETVPTPSPAPQLPQVHTHIHLPANMLIAQQPNLQNQKDDERIYWRTKPELSSITHRKPYKKLKSVQFLKQSTPTEANSCRRLSI